MRSEFCDARHLLALAIAMLALQKVIVETITLVIVDAEHERYRVWKKRLMCEQKLLLKPN